MGDTIVVYAPAPARGAEGSLAEETTTPGRPSLAFAPGAELSPRGLLGVVVLLYARLEAPVPQLCESPASVQVPSLATGTLQHQGLRSDVTTRLHKKAAPSQ